MAAQPASDRPDGSGAAPGRPPARVHPGDVLALVLLVGWGGLFLTRIHYGVDLTDEGMYLATSDRLARGDLPFRDVRENGLRQFDIMNAMVWRHCLWSSWGGCDLVRARMVGVVFQLVQMAALWLAVRRWSGPWIAAVTACLVPCVPLFGIWTPGYNEWSCTATVVCACALALAGTAGVRTAVVCGMVAGLTLGLDVLVYAPTAALAVVPLGMAMWGWWRGSLRHPWVRAGALCLAVSLAVVAADAGAIIAAGLGPAWIVSTHEMIDQQDGAIAFTQRLATFWGMASGVFWQVLETAAILAAMRLAIFWMMRRPTPARTVAAGAAAVLGGLLALAWNLLDDLGHADEPVFFGTASWVTHLWFAQMILGLAGILVFLVPHLGGAWKGRSAGAVAMAPAVAMIALYALITAMSSSIGAFNGLHIRGAALALGAAAGAALVGTGAAARLGRTMAVLGIAGMVIVGGLTARASWVLVYKDALPRDCTAAFAAPPLSGMRSTPALVAAIDRLRAWMDAHVAPDAHLLVYHNAPFLYYALHRAPWLDTTYTSTLWTWNDPAKSDAFQGRLIAGADPARQPAVCVRVLGSVLAQWPCSYRLSDPLHLWATAHFAPAVLDWPYEILLPRTAATPLGEPPPLIDIASQQPFDASARVILAPDASVAPGGDGSLVLTTDSPGDEPILWVQQHGRGAVVLRLRIASDQPGICVVPACGTRTGPLIGTVDPRNPGWDTAFPGGAEDDRGYAIQLARFSQPTPSRITRRIVLKRLALTVVETLPDAP